MVHLGCARNQIDSEVILGRLVEGGIQICASIEDAEVAIVNTCSFIGAARRESEEQIEALLVRKRAGKLKGVVVAGCLPQLQLAGLQKRFSEVDAFLTITDYREVPAIVGRIAGGGEDLRRAVSGAPRGDDCDLVRVLSSPPSYAYLRLSEGCDHSCSFCLIPTIRGKMRSKPLEMLVREAHNLASLGVRELVLVAEDSTGYGRDLGDRFLLPRALEALADVAGIEWVRLMYAYPNDFPWEVADLMAGHEKVLPYIDMPIQHISTPVLKAMRRSGSGQQVRRTLERLRERVPALALRTTLMVGFPGEGEREFAELAAWVDEFACERLGVFAYSPEPGTRAFGLDGAVAGEEALARRDQILRQQGAVIARKNSSLIGQRLRVLVDQVEEGRFVARTYRDAPEVDCAAVGARGAAVRAGEFVEARVEALSADGYDLLVTPF